MQKQAAKRKLTTILYADIAGYSRLTGQDELDTHHRVMDALDFASISIKKNNGTVLRFAGDAILAEFQSVVDCVSTSISIQTEVHKRNQGLTEENKVQFRIGVNLGEVLEDRNEIFGEGVNVAARLEASAKPGGINLSEIVHDQIKGKIDDEFQSLGYQEFKNIEKPVQVFSWQPGGLSQEAHPKNKTSSSKTKKQSKAKLHIKLLDHFELSDSNGEVINLNNSKAEAIIAFLALSSDGKETRKNLAELLWSRHADEQARASLRQCLSHLKRKFSKFDKSLINADRQTISLNHLLLQSEFDFIQRDLDSCDFQEVFKSWDGDLMVGLSGIDESFDEWLKNEKQRLFSKLQQKFEEEFEVHKKNVDLKKAVSTSELIFKLNPKSEFGHRGLMEVYHLSNQNDKAIQQYERLVSLLNENAGSNPSSLTSQLYSKIQASESNLTSTIPVSATEQSQKRRTEKPVISLMPIDFVQIEDADHSDVNKFLMVLNDELITSLARFREFNVKEIADSSIKEKELSEHYGVDYVLKGQIIASSDNSKLNVRISTISTATQLWANTFEYENAKIFQSLNDTVNEIIDVVKYSLTTDRYGQSTENLTAYDYWLKASVMNYNWTRENEEKSITFYRKAIAMDSDFARAYSSLASVLNLRNNFTPGYRNDGRDRQEAKYLIRRALELDPMDARNHINAAWGNILAREFDEAEYHLITANKLNPRSANIIAGYSMGMGYLGKAEDVIDNFNKSVKNNVSVPLYHYGYLGILNFLIEDYDQSCTEFQKAGELMPTFMAWHASALYHNGLTELAKIMTSQFKTMVIETWNGIDEPTNDEIIDWLKQVETLKNKEDQSRVTSPLWSTIDS